MHPKYQRIVIAALLHPKCLVKLPKNTIPRNYEITNKRLLPFEKALVQNVSSRDQVSKSIIVASAQGLRMDAVKRIEFL